MDKPHTITSFHVLNDFQSQRGKVNRKGPLHHAGYHWIKVLFYSCSIYQSLYMFP